MLSAATLLAMLRIKSSPKKSIFDDKRRGLEEMKME